MTQCSDTVVPPISTVTEPDFLSRCVPEDRGHGSACLIWGGATTSAGYGNIYVQQRRRTELVHRLAYQTTHGRIPEGKQIDHLCRQKTCCNVAHLEAVTQQENTRRAKAQVTRCPSGHSYTTENTSFTKQGWRKCRACMRAYNMERRNVA